MNKFYAVLFLLLFTACNTGPPQGTLHGIVSINGELVDGGLIRLVPVDGDSQPADCIITQGQYEITMPTGEKKVELRWMKGPSGVVDTASQGTQAPSVQMFPAKYNDQTTLTHTLAPGKVKRDFEIKEP